MTKLPVAAVIAVALFVAGLAPAGAHAAGGFWRCGGSFGPTGEPGEGFWHDIRATRRSNVSKRRACEMARQVIGAYLPPSGTGPEQVQIRLGRKRQVYKCRLRTDRDPRRGTLARCVRVSGKRAVVKAIGQP